MTSWSLACLIPSSHMRLLFAASCLVLWLWGHQVHFLQWFMDPFGPEGRRWKGRRDVCVRGYAQSTIRGMQCRGWSEAGRLCCAVPEEGRLPATGALGTHCQNGHHSRYLTLVTRWDALGYMLQTPLMPKSPWKSKTSKARHRHKQLQGVILGPTLLVSSGACVFHALHPSWQAALSVNTLQKLLPPSAHWQELVPLICRDGGYRRTDSTTQLALPWVSPCTPSWMEGNKPFREGSQAEGLEVKSSLGELGG